MLGSFNRTFNLLFSLLFISNFGLGQASLSNTPNTTAYQKAPFNKKYDKLCTNDWWNRKSNKIIQLKVPRNEVIAFGIYTISDYTLKITAQFFPLYPAESKKTTLEFFENGKWEFAQSTLINEIGWSALFRVENWDDTKDINYRIRHGENAFFEGSIRKNPIDSDEFVIAALSCNSNKDRGDRANYVRNINHQNPDLVFFAGDQSYDHKEHTAAWLKFGMQFREIFRHRPCITIPDDHDVGQLNLWGEYGKKANTMLGVRGGYHAPAAYVNMVERCQTAHLPDAFAPTPIQQNISVYYTSLNWGGIDFAILEDRKFKSGPKGKIKYNGVIRRDLITKKNYDPKNIDLPELKLLGNKQLDFLAQFANKNDHLKVILSQTAFCNGTHRYGRFKKRNVADLDSNGWPQTGRNKALELIKKANAIHIAGDQHLATVIQHGIDEHGDGPIAFTVPAIVNDIYSRWWWPENAGKEPWNGNFLDGFGNKITMLAYANPNQSSNGSGYGIIRINKEENEVIFECWPRNVDVRETTAKQFVGWPVIYQIR